MAGFEVDKYSSARATLPYVLSGVCRQWRGIVLNTAHLWTYIGSRSQGKGYDYLDLALRRSRSAPLHIVIDAEGWAPSLYDIEPMFAVLTKAAYCLQRVHIVLPRTFDAHQVTAFLDMSTPMLRDVAIICIDNEGVTPPDADFTILPSPSSASHEWQILQDPSKRHVLDMKSTGGRTSALLSPSGSAVRSLREFRFLIGEEMSFSDVWDVLALMPSLESLECCEDFDPEDGGNIRRYSRTAPPQKLDMPNLKHLCLSAFCAGMFAEVAHLLPLQALTYLHMYEWSIADMRAILAFVPASVTTVYFSPPDGVVDAECVALLSPLTHLEHLTLVAEDAILVSFFDELSRTAAWPCLGELYMCGGGDLSETAARSLMSFVQDRRSIQGSHSSLASLRVMVDDLEEPEWLLPAIEKRGWLMEEEGQNVL
ncbi:hypothetical protein EXIGLDRAFT_733177, partial [Exidia glandulosa HHB12029]